MRKITFKRGLIAYLCNIFIITGFIGVLELNANDVKKTKQKIEDAKKIWEIENLYNKADEKSMLKLSLFIEDENKGIREIASRKLILLNNGKAAKYLKEAKRNDIKAKAKIADILIKSKNKKTKIICEEILDLKRGEVEIYENKVKILDSTKNKKDKEKLFDSLRKLRTENSGKFVYIFCERGWVDYLPMDKKKYPKLAWQVEYHPEVVYTRVKEKINKLPPKKRKKELINLLINWEIVMEYEAAIRLLAEMGGQVVPDILELVDDKKNIPTKGGPPWDKQHTTFDILLVVLKSIPDEKSIPKLEELSNSKVEYISQLAKETLEWIKSGVPYPFKYERILLASPDEY